MTRRRKWVPRPSAAAREQILGAVRELLAADDALTWVTMPQLYERLGDSFTRNTVRNYTWSLVGTGELVRLANGVFALPSCRA